MTNLTPCPTASGAPQPERRHGAARDETLSPPVPHGVRALRRLADDERGAETAEYAIATMAAVAFAGLLVVIMRSDTVRAMLESLVQQALTFAG